MTDKRVLTPGVILQLLLFIVVVPFFPLLISWRWDWWEAWVYALIAILGFVVSRALAARRHPHLLAERARMLRHEDAETWDKVLAPLVGPGLPSRPVTDHHTLHPHRAGRQEAAAASGWLSRLRRTRALPPAAWCVVGAPYN